ncbi:ferritin-like domain-containing protein [Thioalkalivibrio sp. ALE12]|uniref:ferritin-like domain-containing protein n=1 Tax=Thioalkalivibrio sp. ALE12 TaxID=1158170 RepID=UPI0003A089C9|nr:ferritin-like domain-containing protein [Thioalkalivibrio sp. ALE12]
MQASNPNPESAPESPVVYRAAEAALRERDPETKCERALELIRGWWAGELEAGSAPAPERMEVPGRPEHPVLVHPKDLPRRGLHTTAGRVALVHAVAHIEFNAINLALDAVYRFRDMPAPFVSDWLQVAAEEARHFRLLRARLNELGADYGDLPAHNGLWEAALATDHDVMIRMALVPRVLEARGLDVTPGMIERLAAAGDHATVALLEIIQREEVAHVAIGTRWFRELAHARGLDPEPLFLELLAEYMPGRVRPPFAHEARRAAGFTDSEMAQLAAQATTEPSA